MSKPDTLLSAAGESLEREKWEAERAFRERELSLKERELAAAHAGSRWKSPITVALLAAAVAALGNAFVARTNSDSQTELEAQKAEDDRILEVIKTGNPDRAAENLRFLVDVGLIGDPTVRRKLSAFLDTRRPGTGPALAPATGAARLVSKLEGRILKPYRDAFGRWTIGSGHVLTSQERRSGTLAIGGKHVKYKVGITSTQADQLLAQDLQAVRRQVLKLVKVRLTQNQLDALTSFAWNVGIPVLADSSLLRKLNAGKYAEVPDELMRWTRAGDRVVPGLVLARQREVDLWNK